MPFNGALRNPSFFVLAGPSFCGKTTFALNLLRRAGDVMEDPRCLQNVIYYYKENQPAFDRMQKESIVSAFVGHPPTIEDVKERCERYKDSGGSIIG